MSAPARVSAGNGAHSGQFAPCQHAEPDVVLVDVVVDVDDLDAGIEVDIEVEVELDDEICSHCGEDAGGGDGYGYDGFCGNCADLVDQHDEGEHSARNDRCPMCAG